MGILKDSIKKNPLEEYGFRFSESGHTSGLKNVWWNCYEYGPFDYCLYVEYKPSTRQVHFYVETSYESFISEDDDYIPEDEDIVEWLDREITERCH